MERLSSKAVIQTVTKTAPAVLTALIATSLGFLALYTSPVPMIQDFGKMLTIGMIVSFIIGLLFAIPALYVRDRFFSQKKDRSDTKMNKQPSKFTATLEHMTSYVIKARWLIIVLAFVTAGIGIWADLQVSVETDIETFMPQDVEELQDIHKLRDIIGTTDQISILYSGADVLSEEALIWVDDMTTSLVHEFAEVVVETQSLTSVLRLIHDGDLPNTADIESLLASMPKNQLKMLMNEDRSKGVITVGIKHLEAQPLKEFIDDVNAHIANHRIDALKVSVTGKAVLDVEMITALTSGRYKMTLLGMLAVFLGLLIIYRHPLKAFIPLIPIILIVGWSGGVMYLLGNKYTPLTATLGALIIGIGTEFTILIMERFFEEQVRTSSREEAITASISKIGVAIIASALTTIGGFSALLISDFKILSNFGMMTLVNIFFALLSSVVVMPAILYILGGMFKKTKQNLAQ